MGLPDDEGLIYMLSKRVTEKDAAIGYFVAQDTFKARYPRRRAPCIQTASHSHICAGS